MFDIQRYTQTDRQAWNDFVAQSKQGTFLFDRGFMDYPGDRFTDHSLMVYRKGRLYALLPANAEGDTLWSHQGLTYGGLLTDHRATVAEVGEVFDAINSALRADHFHRVVYKAVPWIYHRIPAEEDLYALVNGCDARIVARHVSTTLTSSRLGFEESRKSGLRKAVRAGVEVVESDDYAAFWQILEANLQQRYGVHPVHTLEEMRLLKSRFPNVIRLFLAIRGEKTLGGSVVFETPQVVHTQYISASAEGKACGALDMLFDHLINHRYAHVPYFDFGKSTNGDGHDLNHSLIFQKEGFGGRAVCYDWYEYNL